MTVPSLSNRTPRIAMASPRLRHPSSRADRPLLRARVDRQIADRRRLTRERVGGIPGYSDLVEARRASIVKQQPSGQPLTDADDLLQHLGSLQRADDADGRTQHADLGAVG